MIGKLIEAKKLNLQRQQSYYSTLAAYISSAAKAELIELQGNFGDYSHPRPEVEQLALAIDLGRYTRGKASVREKVEFTGALIGNQSTPWSQANDEALRRLAKMTKRRRKAVRHVVVSLRPGEQPSLEQAAVMARILAQEAGCEQAVTLFAKHVDTENPHFHFMLVTLDEAGSTLPFGARDPDGRGGVQSKMAVHRALARIEHEQGWSREPGRLFDVEGGRLIRRQAGEAVGSPPQNQHSRQLEQESGFWSLTSIAKREILPRLLDPTMRWQRLHRELADLGLAIDQKGHGGVVQAGTQSIKLSTIDRSISWNRLKDLPIGKYQPREADVQPRPWQPWVYDRERAARYLELKRKQAAASDTIGSKIAELAMRQEAACRQIRTSAQTAVMDRNTHVVAVADHLIEPIIRQMNSAFSMRISALRMLRKQLDKSLTALDPADIDFSGLDEACSGLFDASAFPDDAAPQPMTLPGFKSESASGNIVYFRHRDRHLSPALVDAGVMIFLNMSDEDVLTAAILLAAARWEKVAAIGDEATVARMIAIGKKLGVEIEPHSQTLAKAPAQLGHRNRRWNTVDLRNCLQVPKTDSIGDNKSIANADDSGDFSPAGNAPDPGQERHPGGRPDVARAHDLTRFGDRGGL